MTNNQGLILVTGATGFVGRHVSPALRRCGWKVRYAVRKPTFSGDEVVIKSIGANTDWSTALAGVQSVVHLAAHVHHAKEEHVTELYQSVNTKGTLHLARCAANSGVRQFIFVSTVLVHGRRNDGGAPFSELDTLNPRGLYGISKAAAEAGLKEVARESNMSITVIRPPLVYGAGAKGSFALLADAVKRGVPLPLAAINNHRAFLSVENLISFILRRLQKLDGKFETFLVADAEQVSTPEFVRRLAYAAGKSARLFAVPTSLLSTVLALIGRQEAVDGLIGSLALDISKAISTGWLPKVTLDEGLRHALSKRHFNEVQEKCLCENREKEMR